MCSNTGPMSSTGTGISGLARSPFLPLRALSIDKSQQPPFSCSPAIQTRCVQNGGTSFPRIPDIYQDNKAKSNINLSTCYPRIRLQEKRVPYGQRDFHLHSCSSSTLGLWANFLSVKREGSFCRKTSSAERARQNSMEQRKRRI